MFWELLIRLPIELPTGSTLLPYLFGYRFGPKLPLLVFQSGQALQTLSLVRYRLLKAAQFGSQLA